MNKTIHQLEELNQAEQTDELIIYDVSASDTKKIKVQNLVGSYSTDETFTGKYWIDGKPIYRKVIDFGALPNTTEKTVNHNISNLDTLIKMECIAKSASGAMNIPYINISDSSASVSIFYNTTNIAIRTGYDRSAYRAIVILEYTKTS